MTPQRRSWGDLGGQVSAESDFPVGQFGAVHSVWGMTTRRTVIGVKGPEHYISYDEALTLHTAGAARLAGEKHLRGALTPAVHTRRRVVRAPKTEPFSPRTCTGPDTCFR
ncbi:amidohydrolase family protein [Streptomyces sp. NPDC001537]